MAIAATGRGSGVCRGTRQFLKGTVEGVADAETFLERLDVDVGGPFAQCFAEDLVHEIHHRGFFLLLVELGHLLLVFIGGGGVAAFEELVELLRSDSVALAQTLEDAVAGADGPGDGRRHFAPHGLAGFEVEGIVGHQADPILVDAPGEEPVAQGELGGETPVQGAREVEFRFGLEIEPGIFGDSAGNALLHYQTAVANRSLECAPAC